MNQRGLSVLCEALPDLTTADITELSDHADLAPVLLAEVLLELRKLLDELSHRRRGSIAAEGGADAVQRWCAAFSTGYGERPQSAAEILRWADQEPGTPDSRAMRQACAALVASVLPGEALDARSLGMALARAADGRPGHPFTVVRYGKANGAQLWTIEAAGD